jgi:hypothetical protein
VNQFAPAAFILALLLGVGGCTMMLAFGQAELVRAEKCKAIESQGFVIIWTDAALADDTGGWPIIADVETVRLNPETGLMEMTEPELCPVKQQETQRC